MNLMEVDAQSAHSRPLPLAEMSVEVLATIKI